MGLSMTRANLASLMVLIIGVPAAAAATFFTSPVSPKACFVAGQTAYRITTDAPADVTVRIDNAAANPSLRMQIVNDPATADFVLLDDSEDGDSCGPHTTIKTVRLDPATQKPDLTVGLSRNAGDVRIYARSPRYSDQDVAALFAVIWHGARKAGLSRAFAARP